MRNDARRTRLGFIPLSFVLAIASGSLGFDLDRGELACEQAAQHLMDCCPELQLPRWTCIQEGGCTRELDGTLIAEGESDCLRSMECAEIAAAEVCERLAARIEAEADPQGPPLYQLYQEDWLCD
ncbi:MAG: hypothetical protein HOW73_33475 [Polyangiaceae bacterium]|nr:hypothetical protein [Polyangiaceae bacterium]